MVKERGRKGKKVHSEQPWKISGEEGGKDHSLFVEKRKTSPRPPSRVRNLFWPADRGKGGNRLSSLEEEQGKGRASRRGESSLEKRDQGKAFPNIKKGGSTNFTSDLTEEKKRKEFSLPSRRQD